MNKPTQKPNNPCFSSGPCAKRPGWSVAALENVLAGRSHRAAPSKVRIKEIITKHRALLKIPADYKIGILPGSDTGAVEMALWSMLADPKDGGRGIDVFAWESFSSTWLKDITNVLKLEDVRAFEADYGAIPDLSQADPARDTVFAWNGTTSGARVPNGEWISDDREGITICDATSAVFAYDMPWEKLDVTTWSWQKVIGSEAAHGMMVLSPRAVERLESFVPPRPIPKIMALTKKGKLIEGIFEGLTINTPSMLAVEDCHDALDWVESIGGLEGTIQRSHNNFTAVESWVAKTPWIEFLAEEEATRSKTAACLKITDAWFNDLEDQAGFIKALVKTLESEDAGYDLGAYRDAPPGLRIWCGATVETSNIEALLPWIEWAYETAKEAAQKQAA